MTTSNNNNNSIAMSNASNNAEVQRKVYITDCRCNTKVLVTNSATESFRSILARVADIFGQPADDHVTILNKITLANFPANIRAVMLDAIPVGGEEIIFDIPFVDSEDTLPAQGAGERDITETPRLINVIMAGGSVIIEVEINPGTTTIYDALHNDLVRNRSRFTDAQISSCAVLLNDETVEDSMLPRMTLRAGDTISLTSRTAKSLG